MEAPRGQGCKNYLFIYFMCTCICLLEVICTTCLQEPVEARRGYWIPQKWAYRHWRAVMWALRTEPRFSA